MFKTIVHQALQNRSNNEYVEENGPFPVNDVESSYLGSGYYFWDNHIELAHWWGERHCKNKYILCEGNIEVEDFYLLDLIGNREDQINFQKLIEKLNVQNMVIGKVIELLKDINKSKEGTFPYKVIRAVDNSYKKSFPQTEYQFSEHPYRKGYSIFSPMYIICLIEKNKIILPRYEVIFTR